MPILGILASSAPAAAGTAFESIASATGTGTTDIISFTSIPSTYQHLQLRFSLTTGSSGWAVNMRLNNDTGSNYAYHYLSGNGATASAGGIASDNLIVVAVGGPGTDTTQPTVAIIDIHDYASTTKNKTVRSFAGLDKNGSGEISLRSGLWINTAAINRLDIFLGASNMKTNSTFALYGIKGA